MCTGQYWLKQKQKMTPLFSSPHRAKVLSESLVVSHNLAEPVDFLASVSLALEPVRSKVLYDVSGDLLLMKVCHALSQKVNLKSYSLLMSCLFNATCSEFKELMRGFFYEKKFVCRLTCFSLIWNLWWMWWVWISRRGHQSQARVSL